MFLSLSPAVGRTLCCRSRSRALSDGFCLREPELGTLDMMRGWSTTHSKHILIVCSQSTIIYVKMYRIEDTKEIYIVSSLYIGWILHYG